MDYDVSSYINDIDILDKPYLKIISVQSTMNQIVSVNGFIISFKAKTNFNGLDTIKYIVSDEKNNSNIGNIFINVQKNTNFKEESFNIHWFNFFFLI
jgi:hypothetical protein